MDIAKEFGTDKSKEEDGTVIPLGEDAWVKVRRSSSKKARDTRERLQRPYGKMRTIPESVQEDILIKVLAQGIIVEWHGLTENGTEVAFEPDIAYRLLKAYPDFRDAVLLASADADFFKAEDDRNAEKNFGTSSNGN